MSGETPGAPRPTVVQFGAGGIGRGFMGQLFTEAGYAVVYVDVDPALVSALNARGSYPLRLVGPDRFETLTVGPVRAVDGRDAEAVAREVAGCALACTAVGVGVLPHLAAPLAAGIRRRQTSLNVILCENQLHCSDLMRGYLARHLEPEALARVGLVESVVSRMVPGGAREGGDPLLVTAEDYPVLPVDRAAWLGPPPEIPGLRPVENFPAYFDRKLYVHNLGHAVTAYVGALRGHATIAAAIAAPEVRAEVEAALGEAVEMLVRKHGFERAELAAHRADLLRRFANAALGDTVGRVGRDPIRKLRPEDRLVGAALACLDWGVEPRAIARGIAAALRFNAADDPSAREVAGVVREWGVGEALFRFTGQRPDGELGRLVLEAWERDEG